MEKNDLVIITEGFKEWNEYALAVSQNPISPKMERLTEGEIVEITEVNDGWCMCKKLTGNFGSAVPDRFLATAVR